METIASTPRRRTRGTLSALNWIAFVLVVIGGINWGLVGLLELDLVAELLGDMSGPARLVYILVGLAALYCLLALPPRRRSV